MLGCLILKLSDKVTLTRVFTARKKNRAVIGLFSGGYTVSIIFIFKKLTNNFKKTLVKCFLKKHV